MPQIPQNAGLTYETPVSMEVHQINIWLLDPYFDLTSTALWNINLIESNVLLTVKSEGFHCCDDFSTKDYQMILSFKLSS